ncbi:hypothetical protein NKR23_g5543 [Pleurostoma richardsiae]|uniref:Zn(2)-C6 fungal-type domain-containing protein n=1 Tax=Pleurostoma richardsiae TaxID=41990 RepID=A0AA38RGE3_9PEZI|nr:hypothetical protein NKR23_g5543 [Pleurostoma richardsiae]
MPSGDMDGSARSSSSAPAEPRFRPIRPRPAVPPAAPPPTPSKLEKRPRILSPAACDRCRRKKIRCDGRRPACSACLKATADCKFPVPEGLTRREAEKRKFDEVAGANRDLESVVRLLRDGKESEAVSVLNRIRQADNLDDAVQSIAHANIHNNRLLDVAPDKRSPVTTSLPGISSFFALPSHRGLSSRLGSLNFIFEELFENSLRATLFFIWDPYLGRVIHHPMFIEDTKSVQEPVNDETCFCSFGFVNATMNMGRDAWYSKPGILDTRGRRFACTAIGFQAQC